MGYNEVKVRKMPGLRLTLIVMMFVLFAVAVSFDLESW